MTKRKIIRRTIVIVVLVLGLGQPLTVRATGQIPDLLIVEGDTLRLFCNPLQKYFDESHPRPEDMRGIFSTACWRGYQACFEFRSDSLFLRSVRQGFKGDSSDFYPLEKLFGDKATPAGVFAYWVNDALSCVDGHLLNYVHMGYESTYEFEIEFIVRQGIMKKKKVFDNRKSFLPFASGHDGLKGFDVSEYSLIQTFVESQIDYSRLRPDEMDKWVHVAVQKVDGEGRIKKFELEMIKPSSNLERAVRRAFKKVPRFNVLYRRGKPIADFSESYKWIMTLKIYSSEEERAKHGPTMGPDIGESIKKEMLEGIDYVWNLEYLSQSYYRVYKAWKEYAADTSAEERPYKEYFCQLFGDPLFYQHHYFMTLGDSSLKYYYQYWDETGDHESLYPIIINLEQELGRPHNPKIVNEKNPAFVYFVLPEEMDRSHKADSTAVSRRCRQVSCHLRGFGEGDLHEPLPDGIQEEWRLLLLHGDYVKKISPVLVKILFDGKDAKIIWRVAKELKWEYYPGLDHFRHGIRSEGERMLTAEEWEMLKRLADEARMDTLRLDNNYFITPPAIYNVEHRTTTGYHVVNDYNHPYYNKEINPLFWPFRAFCKYLIGLADPTLPFDIDDER